MSDIDSERFLLARARVLSEENKQQGIGTLAEKTLHGILKYYFEPDDVYHEIKYKGAFADIMRDGCITEIQTANLSRLSRKLDKFLPDCSVRVVYPLYSEKRIHLIDKASGEISPPRKSPKKCTVCDVFCELWGIEKFLLLDNFSLTLVFLDMDEYRYKAPKGNYRPRATVRCERIPTRVTDIVTLKTARDYAATLPKELMDPFTVKELAAIIKRKARHAQSMISILLRMGVLERAGTAGRAYLYKRAK